MSLGTIARWAAVSLIAAASAAPAAESPARGGPAPIAAAVNSSPAESVFKALRCPVPEPGSTWAVLTRDGGNRAVDPYLSSLAGGEGGTGEIVSPEFEVAVPVIRFTICGHDGTQGGRGQNYIALLDATSGETLAKTAAPGADAMQQQSWDSAAWQGRKVRVTVRDGVAEGAFAWLGIGSIDGGAAFQVDFRSGLPQGWTSSHAEVPSRTELLEGVVPFLSEQTVHTLVPESGSLELPCGFIARRMFVLGCTVPRGYPLEQYGALDLVYASGTRQSVPLICGYTLDVASKRLSPSAALHLHPSADPFQHYLAIELRDERLESVHLAGNPNRETLPRITAITCQTEESAAVLMKLPAGRPGDGQQQWIDEHALRGAMPPKIAAQIRRAHRLDGSAGSAAP